ncbi:hypothetical protein QM467_01405 [Rhodoblastus sp. 17X3]|uniref:hypothetical protein n=1 Tax=Rhodoblastus sp. 17X3 TaxID=3047026 RepID=UPI0024B7B12D|nr:hypothetical protein [Rhodoblastus sp. 17X3]MDI9846711.1 hypothetical protein [Rhodoblastus sp. 17X3]
MKNFLKNCRARGVKRWTPALLAAVCLWSAGPARAQFFPFGGQSEPPRPQAEPPHLSQGQVRAVLAREGARLVGAPRLRGPDIIAIGRDDEGARKRFTLDAISGEVLDITVIARREDRPPRAPASDLSAPGAPLPPPDHAPDGPNAAPTGLGEPATPAAPPPQPSGANAVSAAPASPAAPGQPGAAARPRAVDPADSALSPIKPLRPAGAPKVEPLPQ